MFSWQNTFLLALKVHTEVEFCGLICLTLGTVTALALFRKNDVWKMTTLEWQCHLGRSEHNALCSTWEGNYYSPYSLKTFVHCKRAMKINFWSSTRFGCTLPWTVIAWCMHSYTCKYTLKPHPVMRLLSLKRSRWSPSYQGAGHDNDYALWHVCACVQADFFRSRRIRHRHSD